MPEQSPDAKAKLDDWRGIYSDVHLRRLIELALEHNSDMRVAVLNIERMRAQLRIVDADRIPTVNAAATGLRQQPNTTAGSTRSVSSVYTAGLSVPAWELDFFGRVASLTDVARAYYLATEEARKAVQISLIADVANAYLNCLAQRELLRLAGTTVESRKESLRLTQLKFDNGTASQVDLAQSQSLQASARANVALQTRLASQAMNALQMLVGQPLTADLMPTTVLADEALLPAVTPGLPSDLMIRRPDIRQAEQALIAANASIGAARAAYFPRMTLTASAGLASNELTSLVNGGAGAWSLAPQIVLPLFDSGRVRAGVDTARAAKEIAVAQYQKAVQAAFRDVADALAGEATFDDQVQALSIQAQAEDQRLKLVDLRYNNGTAGYLDLLDAQRSLFLAQQALVQTRLAQQQNRVSLYKALGGGWIDPPPQAKP
jgi:multidrug efflux system outer membrane protein